MGVARRSSTARPNAHASSPSSTARPTGNTMAQLPGRSRPCNARFAGRRTDSRWSAPPRFWRCCGKPDTPGSRHAPGATRAPRCAAGGMGRSCRCTTRSPPPKSRDRARLSGRGRVRVAGVVPGRSRTLSGDPAAGGLVAACPPAPAEPGPGQRWEDWLVMPQPAWWAEGLPPLRVLLIWDNLAGHCDWELEQDLLNQGILPLYTPIAGSWLNLAEAIQRILVRRALAGQHPD